MKISRIVAVSIGIACLLSPAPAYADPTDSLAHDAARFCREMDQNSTPAGVVANVREMRDDGLDIETAEEVINYALSTICPEYLDEFKAAASLYAPKEKLA